MAECAAAETTRLRSSLSKMAKVSTAARQQPHTMHSAYGSIVLVITSRGLSLQDGVNAVKSVDRIGSMQLSMTDPLLAVIKFHALRDASRPMDQL